MSFETRQRLRIVLICSERWLHFSYRTSLFALAVCFPFRSSTRGLLGSAPRLFGLIVRLVFLDLNRLLRLAACVFGLSLLARRETLALRLLCVFALALCTLVRRESGFLFGSQPRLLGYAPWFVFRGATRFVPGSSSCFFGLLRHLLLRSYTGIVFCSRAGFLGLPQYLLARHERRFLLRSRPGLFGLTLRPLPRG